MSSERVFDAGLLGGIGDIGDDFFSSLSAAPASTNHQNQSNNKNNKPQQATVPFNKPQQQQQTPQIHSNAFTSQELAQSGLDSLFGSPQDAVDFTSLISQSQIQTRAVTSKPASSAVVQQPSVARIEPLRPSLPDPRATFPVQPTNAVQFPTVAPVSAQPAFVPKQATVFTPTIPSQTQIQPPASVNKPGFMPVKPPVPVVPPQQSTPFVSQIPVMPPSPSRGTAPRRDATPIFPPVAPSVLFPGPVVPPAIPAPSLTGASPIGMFQPIAPTTSKPAPQRGSFVTSLPTTTPLGSSVLPPPTGPAVRAHAEVVPARSSLDATRPKFSPIQPSFPAPILTPLSSSLSGGPTAPSPTIVSPTPVLPVYPGPPRPSATSVVPGPLHSSQGPMPGVALVSDDRRLQESIRGAHPIVTFGFGGSIVLVFPQAGNKATSGLNFHSSPPGMVTVRQLKDVLDNTDTVQQLKLFPGPLVKAKKDAVVKYVADAVTKHGGGFAENGVPKYPSDDGLLLLWQALKALLKTGTLDPELLKEVRQQLLSGVSQPTPITTPQHSLADDKQHQLALSEIQDCILRGLVDEAYAIAARNQLWAHALLLGYALSPAKFSEIALTFAQSLPDDSPLRILYLLHSNKNLLCGGPNQQAGELERITRDWRRNLAILLGNPTKDSMLAIRQLGDSLWASQRCLEAHVCYLLADYKIERLGDPRLVLLGADHRLKKGFIAPEAVQRTEILEYAYRQANPQVTIPSLQIYKFVYAMWLTEYGFVQEAWNYVSVITQMIKEQQNTYVYTTAFAAEFTEFSKRLQEALNKPSDNSSGSFFTSLLKKGVSAIIGDDEVVTAPVSTPTSPVPPPVVSTTQIRPPAPSTIAPVNRTPFIPNVPGSAILPSGPQRGGFQPSVPAPVVQAPLEVESRSQRSSSVGNKKQEPISKSEHSRTKTPAQPTQNQSKSNESSPKKPASSGWGLLKWIPFGGTATVKEESSGKKMKLGDDNTFYYNQELKCWVERGKEEEYKQKAMGPPPPPTDAELNSKKPSQTEKRSLTVRHHDPFGSVSAPASSMTSPDSERKSPPGETVQPPNSTPSDLTASMVTERDSESAPTTGEVERRKVNNKYAKGDRRGRRYVTHTGEVVDSIARPGNSGSDVTMPPKPISTFTPSLSVFTPQSMPGNTNPENSRDAGASLPEGNQNDSDENPSPSPNNGVAPPPFSPTSSPEKRKTRGRVESDSAKSGPPTTFFKPGTPALTPVSEPEGTYNDTERKEELKTEKQEDDNEETTRENQTSETGTMTMSSSILTSSIITPSGIATTVVASSSRTLFPPLSNFPPRPTFRPLAPTLGGAAPAFPSFTPQIPPPPLPKLNAFTSSKKDDDDDDNDGDALNTSSDNLFTSASLEFEANENQSATFSDDDDDVQSTPKLPPAKQKEESSDSKKTSDGWDDFDNIDDSSTAQDFDF